MVVVVVTVVNGSLGGKETRKWTPTWSEIAGGVGVGGSFFAARDVIKRNPPRPVGGGIHFRAEMRGNPALRVILTPPKTPPPEHHSTMAQWLNSSIAPWSDWSLFTQNSNSNANGMVLSARPSWLKLSASVQANSDFVILFFFFCLMTKENMGSLSPRSGMKVFSRGETVSIFSFVPIIETVYFYSFLLALSLSFTLSRVCLFFLSICREKESIDCVHC